MRTMHLDGKIFHLSHAFLAETTFSSIKPQVDGAAQGKVQGIVVATKTIPYPSVAERSNTAAFPTGEGGPRERWKGFRR